MDQMTDWGTSAFTAAMGMATSGDQKGDDANVSDKDDGIKKDGDIPGNNGDATGPSMPSWMSSENLSK